MGFYYRFIVHYYTGKQYDYMDTHKSTSRGGSGGSREGSKHDDNKKYKKGIKQIIFFEA